MSWLVVGTALAFLSVQLLRAPREAWGALDMHAGWLVLSVFLYGAVLAFGTFLWLQVLNRFEGSAVRFTPLLEVWATSSLTRYLPGGVWQFLVADQVGRRHGLHRPRLFASLAVHTGLSLLSAAWVALAWKGAGRSALAWGLLPLVALLVHPRVLNACLDLLRRWRPLREGLPGWRGSWGAALGLVVLSAAGWIFQGLALCCFLRSVLGTATVPGWHQVVGANATAFLSGYLALFAPGGLGVREVTLAFLLRSALSVELAAAVALLSRLWSVLGELGLLAVAWSLRRAQAAVDVKRAASPSTLREEDVRPEGDVP